MAKKITEASFFNFSVRRDIKKNIFLVTQVLSAAQNSNQISNIIIKKLGLFHIKVYVQTFFFRFFHCNKMIFLNYLY